MSTLEEKVEGVEHAIAVLKTHRAVAEARLALGEDTKTQLQKIDVALVMGEKILKELNASLPDTSAPR